MAIEAIAKAHYVSGPRALEILNEAGIPISKGPVYNALHSGEIPSIKIGNRFFVREDIVTIMGERN